MEIILYKIIFAKLHTSTGSNLRFTKFINDLIQGCICGWVCKSHNLIYVQVFDIHHATIDLVFVQFHLTGDHETWIHYLTRPFATTERAFPLLASSPLPPIICECIISLQFIVLL